MKQALVVGLVALASILPGAVLAAVRPNQQAADTLTLFLGGQHAGAVSEVEGGAVVAEPGGGAPGVDGTAKRQLGPTRAEDLVLTLRMPLDPAVEAWVRDFFLGRRPARDGAVLAWSFDMRTLVEVLAFRGATLVGAELGALAGDQAGPLLLKLTLRAAELSSSLAGPPPSPPGPQAAGRHRSMAVSNFRLLAPGLAGERVASFGPLAVRLDAGGHLVQDPIPVRIAAAGSPEWKAWAEGMLLGGRKGDDQEKSFEVALLAPDLQQVVFRLRLDGVGVSRMALMSGGRSTPPGLGLSLYAERIEFGAAARPADGTGSTTAAVGASGVSTAVAAATPAAAPGAEATAEGHPDDEGSRDPADFPRLGGMVRKSFRYQGDKAYVDERAEYVIPGAPARIEELYREALTGAGWELGNRAESGSLKKGDYVIDLKFLRKDRSARVHLSPAKEGTAVYLNLVETLQR